MNGKSSSENVDPTWVREIDREKKIIIIRVEVAQRWNCVERHFKNSRYKI